MDCRHRPQSNPEGLGRTDGLWNHRAGIIKVTEFGWQTTRPGFAIGEVAGVPQSRTSASTISA